MHYTGPTLEASSLWTLGPGAPWSLVPKYSAHCGNPRSIHQLFVNSDVVLSMLVLVTRHFQCLPIVVEQVQYDVSIGHPSTSASTRRRPRGITSHMPASNTRLPAKSQSLLLAPTVSASPTRKSVSVIPMCATRPAWPATQAQQQAQEDREA